MANISNISAEYRTDKSRRSNWRYWIASLRCWLLISGAADRSAHCSGPNADLVEKIFIEL